MLEAKKLYDEVSELETIEGIKAYIKRNEKKMRAKKKKDSERKKKSPKNYYYRAGYYRVYKTINKKTVSMYVKTEEEAKKLAEEFSECDSLEQILEIKRKNIKRVYPTPPPD